MLIDFSGPGWAGATVNLIKFPSLSKHPFHDSFVIVDSARKAFEHASWA